LLVAESIADVRQAGYKFDGDYNDKNQRHGIGHAEFHNGDVYDGQYENGKRHGRGVYKLVASQYLLNDTYCWSGVTWSICCAFNSAVNSCVGNKAIMLRPKKYSGASCCSLVKNRDGGRNFYLI